jgi:NlpE N-terminal domain
MKYTSLLFFAVVLASCGGNDKGQTNGAALADSTGKTSVNAESKPMLENPVDEIKGILGTYVGQLPCEDCEYIKVAVSLNGDLTAIVKQRKAGVENNNGVVGETKGKWNADETKSDIIVKGDNGSVFKYRIVDTQHLIPLDENNKPLECKVDCQLTKVQPGADSKVVSNPADNKK